MRPRLQIPLPCPPGEGLPEDDQTTPRTRYIPTRDGLPHRCRAKPLPGNRRHPRRPVQGRTIDWLRAFVFYLAKRQPDKSPWVELDLIRACNSKGVSRAACRWLWHWVKVDPLFRRYIKVRYVQKVGPENGWFVILAAWRPKLQWDQEPLFYGRDRETSRHVRAELRGADIEKKNRDCPIPSLSLPEGQPQDNTPQAASENRPSLRSAGSNGEVPNSKALESRISHAIRRTDHGEPERLGKTLCRKCAVVVSQLASDFFTWDPPKFQFPEAHAWNFVSWALVNGFEDWRIARTWRKAVEATVADISDGIARIPPALLVSHARRLLEESDSRGREERIRAFYAGRRIGSTIAKNGDVRASLKTY